MMIVWSAEDMAQRTRAQEEAERAQIVDPRPSVSVADARSWGFEHDVRRPLMLRERVPPAGVVSPGMVESNR